MGIGDVRTRIEILDRGRDSRDNYFKSPANKEREKW